MAAVAAALGVDPDDTVAIENAATASAVLGAIVTQENGMQPYGTDVLSHAYAVAFVSGGAAAVA